MFFRSPQPDHSWVVAAGAVLDGASLMASCVDVPREQRAEFTIRAGYLALRRIAEFFGVVVPRDPHFPEQSISVTREEFDEVWERLEAAQVPMKPDREQAWLDFAGWRVNYDVALIALAGLTVAPVAPWSSDRGIANIRAADLPACAAASPRLVCTPCAASGSRKRLLATARTTRPRCGATSARTSASWAAATPACGPRCT